MSKTPSPRRATLAASYRDLSEKQIRARLDGPLTDAERAVGQAELMRRGLGADQVDTTPASDAFAPTASPESESDEAGAAEVAVPVAAGAQPARRSTLRNALLLLLLLAAAVAFAIYAGILPPDWR